MPQGGVHHVPSGSYHVTSGTHRSMTTSPERNMAAQRLAYNYGHHDFDREDSDSRISTG